jgi:hypothetical protein
MNRRPFASRWCLSATSIHKLSKSFLDHELPSRGILPVISMQQMRCYTKAFFCSSAHTNNGTSLMVYKPQLALAYTASLPHCSRYPRFRLCWHATGRLFYPWAKHIPLFPPLFFAFPAAPTIIQNSEADMGRALWS